MEETTAMVQNAVLILRPQPYFGIVGAELKRVDSYSRYMMARGTIRMGGEVLGQIAAVCEELTPDNLFRRYANKKVFRRAALFWNTTDATVITYVKQMADQRVVKAVTMAADIGIPILYVPTEKTPLHITDRLYLQKEVTVVPVMHFTRHDDGTTYSLSLRMGERLMESIAGDKTVVLTHNPGMFTIDGSIYLMAEGVSAKLLLPFVKKPVVEIPRKMENDYFRRFILKHAARTEIEANGFCIEDVDLPPHPCLTVSTAIDGSSLLTLTFKYDQLAYAPDSKSRGQVVLEETADGGFRFTRKLRNLQAEQHYLELLRQEDAPLQIHGYIPFPSILTLVDWLRSHAPALRSQGFDVVQPSDNIYYIGPLSVEQSDTWQGDWLQTNVTVVIDDGRLRLPISQLANAILHGEQEYMLPTGERLLIPPEWFERYGDLLLIGRKKGNVIVRHRSQLPRLSDNEGDALSGDKPIVPNNYNVSQPQKLKATLRPYQQTGFQWLWRHFNSQTGCCLSDEMGLGKTVQAIALLLKYKETATKASAIQPLPGMLFSEEEMAGEAEGSKAGGLTSMAGGSCSMAFHTSLIVAPASVVHNWCNELARFAPSLMVCNYTGSITQRADKQIALMRWDVVVTTYRTLHNDIGFFSKQQFGIIVFDESQAFKTSTSLIHHAVSRLQAIHRIALSGTPVENNLQELWSLMNVLNPDLLGSLPSFQRAFVLPIAQAANGDNAIKTVAQIKDKRSDLLRKLIAPYFLKRTKTEVLNDLPERQDEVVVCPMTDAQVSSYAKELSRARNEWLDPTTDTSRRQINMLAAIQRLRHIANGQGKMDTVFAHLENLRGTGHKVLIFSEYVSLLETVGAKMRERDWTFDMLTGQTKARAEVIDHFQHTADCQFFLISLKAGGVGLNLTAADYVMLLDPWWNKAAEEQAIARAHRIGQRRAVFVYRYVAENTLEEQILNLQVHKQTLIDSVMPFICQLPD